MGGREVQRAKGGVVALPQGLLAPDLAVELAPSRVDHEGGLRKRLGPLLDQAVI